LRALVPIALIVAGLLVAVLLVATGPEVVPRPPEVAAPRVRVQTVKPQSVRMVVTANGTVVPRTQSDLVPEVSGRVTWTSPALVSGGFFSAGDPLLRIDPLDYEVALEQSRARLARSESQLRDAETDNRRQLDLAERRVSSDAQKDDAANRLRVAQAELREAEATLERATRDLARTEVLAPYDGRVRSEQVDVGQFANRGSPVAKVYAVDFAEVRLPIPDEDLAFLDLPLGATSGTPTDSVSVTLRARFGGVQSEWQGEVVRTEGELDPRTRMVNVVARVEAPYAPQGGRPPLAVGLFVEAEIAGSLVEKVVVLPRSALRGASRLIVVDAEDRLRFRDVDVLRLSRDLAYIRAGLEAGERVVVSPIESAIEGMLVRVSGDERTVAQGGDS
jgi:RND family efflux transporter MFP subunit